LEERGLFIENSYYLTNKIPIIIPCKSLFEAVYFYAGSLVYHSIYLFYNKSKTIDFDFPYFLSTEQMNEKYPLLDKNYKYGVVYYDG
jgi:glycerol-3-phosphate dehydrogenase